MIKKNLLKTVMLGVCMAALTTGSAYATLAQDTTPSATEDMSAETKALYAKQEEIDSILFKANAKEIEKRGFMINYTGVVEDYIEIGISPFNDENAKFIYELVGKDGIKVIEFDESILYATGAAPDVVTDADVDTDVVVDKEEAAEDADTQASVDDKEVQIQIESTTDDLNNEEKVYKTTSADGEEIRTVSASDESDKDGVSAPMVVLAIVGGAALVGGGVLLSSKKKASK